MEAIHVLIAAALSGVGVVVATTAATRLSGAWAGILATLPITPTSGILALGGAIDGISALRGLATIAAVLIVIVVLLAVRPLHHRTAIMVGLVAIAPLAFLIDRMAPPLVGLAAIASLFASRACSPLPPVQKKACAHMPWPVRFLVGAVAVVIVAASEALYPGLGILLAMMPVLFVTSLAVVLFGHGADVALGMLRGGVAGGAGMVAFVSAYAIGWHQAFGPLPALGLAWVAFVVTALAWRWLQRDPRAGPVGV